MKHNKQFETCVFYFFNETQNKTKKHKIHKIMQNDFFIQNELTNQQKLLKIKERKTHFYLCENVSELIITHIDEEDTKIKHKNFKQDNTILLEFEDCKLIYFKNYLKALSSSTKYLLIIINFYKYLFFCAIF